MTNGFGSMYSYAARIEPEDRWRIAAYIRVLQLSQHATIEDVPEAERRKLTQPNSCSARTIAMSVIRDTLHAYLVGYIYWLMIPLGCTAILMMHHLTGGWWGYPIRRMLEAGSRTFGLMAVLFLPILPGCR